jgi:endonuclease YncB( thermonuclease family)
MRSPRWIVNFAAFACRLWRVDAGRTLQINQVVGVAVVSLVLAALPAAGCEGLTSGPAGRVVGVSDGDTVLLDTGQEVRLVGLQAPKLPKGREDFEPWPLAESARARLEALTLGQRIEVRHGGAGRDRHGRVLGQVFVAGAAPVWVQSQMLAEGLARVYSFPDNRACLAELLAIEAQARADRLGIWADQYYTVRRADRPGALLARAGLYELVEGRVLLAEKVGGRVYLNFGRYWKVDVTAVIEARALRLFAGAGLDPLGLEGALVRLRGWVDDRDGPRIELTHPEQIEVLARP